MATRRGRSNPRAAAAYKAALAKDKATGSTAPVTTGGRRTRAQQAATHASRKASKDKGDAAAAKAEEAGSSTYKARAAATFDKAKSQKLREESAKKSAALQATKKSGGRISGRAASRAKDQARVHGRTDEQKIESQAGAARNRKIATNILTTALPGGAASGALFKAKQAAGALKGAAGIYKTAKAAKLAKNVKNVKNLAQGAKVAAKKRVQQFTGGTRADLAKRAKVVGQKAIAKAKAKAKAKAQGAANTGVNEIAST